MPRNLEVFNACYGAYQRCREILDAPQMSRRIFGLGSAPRGHRGIALQYVKEFEETVTLSVTGSPTAERTSRELFFTDDPLLSALRRASDKEIQIKRMAGGRLRANRLWPPRTALGDLGETF